MYKTKTSEREREMFSFWTVQDEEVEQIPDPMTWSLHNVKDITLLFIDDAFENFKYAMTQQTYRWGACSVVIIALFFYFYVDCRKIFNTILNIIFIFICIFAYDQLSIYNRPE